jgi:hypothetical protein
MCPLRSLFTLVLATALIGCGGGVTFPEGGSPPDDSPATFTLLAWSGNGQEGTVWSRLDDPLIVKVIDSSSTPIAGVPVVFQLKNTVPFAEVDQKQAETNSEGLAWAEVRLGANTGSLEVEARVPTVPDLKTTFVVTAIEGGGGDGDDDDDDDDDD